MRVSSTCRPGDSSPAVTSSYWMADAHLGWSGRRWSVPHRGGRSGPTERPLGVPTRDQSLRITGLLCSSRRCRASPREIGRSGKFTLVERDRKPFGSTPKSGRIVVQSKTWLRQRFLPHDLPAGRERVFSGFGTLANEGDSQFINFRIVMMRGRGELRLAAEKGRPATPSEGPSGCSVIASGPRTDGRKSG